MESGDRYPWIYDLRITDIENIKISLPTIEEQKKIANKLKLEEDIVKSNNALIFK